MNLVMVVERPTQFEVPLFRLAQADPDHHLRVLYTDPAAHRPPLDPEIGRHVTWESDPLSGYDHAVAPARGLAAWLRAELAGPHDLVVVNGYTRRPYQIGVAAARRAGSPVALRIDSVGFDEGSGPRRFAKRLLFRLAVRPRFQLFFAVGTLTLEYLQGLGVERERTALLPYPVDTVRMRHSPAAETSRAAWRERLATPPTAPVVLALAKLHPRETPWELLRAWPRAAGDDRWLWLAGDGPDRAAVEQEIESGRLPRVRLPGYVPYPELPGLYRAADAFVHAPRAERWGVSVGEALACGLPVVASSQVGAAHDLVASGTNGFVYTAGNTELLIDNIGQALELDRRSVDAASRAILESWSPRAAWQSMVSAAARTAA